MIVEGALIDETFFQSLSQHHEHLAALEVGTIQHSVHRGRQRVFMRLVLATVVEVVDGIAVGQHNGVVVPLATKDVNQKAVAGTTGFAFISVVGAHHLAYITFLYQCLESG